MYGYVPRAEESDIYQYQIEIELLSFHQYLELTNNFWNEKIKEFNEKLDTIDDWDKQYFDKEWHILNSVPNILKSSLLISIYSFFETEFDRVVKEFASKKSMKLQLTDISDKGIDRAKKYIEKVLLVDLSSLKQEWDLLKDFQKIRNTLSHSGYITKKTDVVKLIKNNGQYFDFNDTNEEFHFSFKGVEYHQKVLGEIQFFLVNSYKLLHSNIK